MGGCESLSGNDKISDCSDEVTDTAALGGSVSLVAGVLHAAPNATNYYENFRFVVRECAPADFSPTVFTSAEDALNDYIKKCEDQSWAFAFYQDLRNFVQHCGLPTGKFSRTASRHSVNLELPPIQRCFGRTTTSGKSRNSIHQWE
jgi:hypothetical protein